MLLVSQITIFFGIYSYTTNHQIHTVLHYVAISFFFAVSIILETNHQWFLSREPVHFNEPLNTINEEDFELELLKGK